MRIGIIGLGLIGGSLFRDLRKKYDVVAVSKSQDGENIYKSYDVLKNCDIVFVCSAMNKTLAILDELENVLSETTVVVDVCSLKEFVCKKKRPYKFIPSHPMAGTENKGFESSFEGLFKGKKWVVTLSEKELNDIGYLKEIVDYLGAKLVFTTPKEHDRAVALISHMPMVIAQSLMQAVKDDKLALEIASSGFLSMTRLAMSNEEMACDMVSMNSENIEQAILKLYKAVGELTSGNYPEIISELKNLRKQMQ